MSTSFCPHRFMHNSVRRFRRRQASPVRGRRSAVAVSAVAVISALALFSPSSAQPDSLTIADCLEAVRTSSLDVLRNRQALRQLEYERWELRSRFLPKVRAASTYHLTDGLDGVDTFGPDRTFLEAEQTILEFGEDAPEDVTFRSRRRAAFYDYENVLRSTLSQVRRNFYLAILKRQQIESRRAVLQNVTDKLEKVRIKYDHKVAKEFDLLTAELDSLEQEAQISQLEGQREQLRFELMRLIGRPIDDPAPLAGDAAPRFDLDLVQAVQTAVERDVEARRLREELDERKREFDETSFAYAPDIGMQIGIRNGDASTRLQLASSGTKTWRLSSISDYVVATTETSPALPGFQGPERQRFARFDVSVPLFLGLERYGQTGAARERLRQQQTRLWNRRDEIERDVRRRYQLMDEESLQLEIDRRRLDIALRRLEIQERLRSLGEVTDNQVETFRQSFFASQEGYFRSQDAYIQTVEDLRETIGYFE